MHTLRPLTEEERSDLEESLKQTKDIADWKRVFVILSYDDGLSIDELAKLTRLSRWTVEDYLKKYSSQNKTKNAPRGGSSSKLMETEEKVILLPEPPEKSRHFYTSIFFFILIWAHISEL